APPAGAGARHLSSRTTQPLGLGSRYPRSSWVSNSSTRHWVSAATAQTSSSVGSPSQIRTSTVPYRGCGRTSHQTSRIDWIAWLDSSPPMYRSKSGQLVRWSGSPAVGSASKTLLRYDASPVSWPTQYGLEADSAR